MLTIPSIHIIQTGQTFNIMTFDETNKFVEADFLLDNDHFVSDAEDFSPVSAAQPAVSTYSSSKANSTPANDQANTNTRSSASQQGTDQDADMVSHNVQHNVQHKKNVVIGVAYGVLLGAVLLGPIGAVAGGFGGRVIVRRRERRWCQRQSRVGEATSGEVQKEECVVVDVIAADNDTSTTTADPAFLVVTE